MSHYYPVLLNLKGKRCLVIGDSWAAEEKVRGLLEAGAIVTLIAPLASDELQKLAERSEIAWQQRDYEQGDLAGYFLVVAARSDRELNHQIWLEAESEGVPFNAVDDQPHCSLIYPAIYRQRDLIVAVSSSGRSPAVASRLRDRFAAELGPEYADFLDILGEMRAEMASRFPDFESRKRLWYQLVDSDALSHLRRNDPEEARRMLRSVLEKQSP